MMKNKVIMSCDIETTGLSVYKDKIIEIGAYKVYPNGKTANFSELIKIDTELPKEIIKLTKITDEMLKEKGKQANEVYDNFKDFIEDVDIIIGHNIISFDNRFIDKAIPNVLLYKEMIDTLQLSRQTLELANHKLSTLVNHFGIEFDGQHHRALDDAKTTYKVFERLIEKRL